MDVERMERAAQYWSTGWRRWITFPLAAVLFPVACTGVCLYVIWNCLKGMKH